MKKTSSKIKQYAGYALALCLGAAIVQGSGYLPRNTQCQVHYDLTDPNACPNGNHIVFHFDDGWVLGCGGGAAYGSINSRVGNCVYFVSQTDCDGWLSNPIMNSYGVWTAVCLDPCTN